MENCNGKMMRTATIRISAKNVAHKDDETLGIHAGDIIRYSKDEIVNILTKWSLTKEFNYYMIEHNEDCNNVHFHIVIEFQRNSSCKFDTIKNKFPYGNIDSCRNGVRRCVQYLVHMNQPDKYQYDWNEVITNSPAKLEKYKLASNNNAVMLSALIEKICKGEITPSDIDKIDQNLYCKYANRIKNAFAYYEMHIKNKYVRNVTVIVLQGPSRSGKTTFCKAFAENQKIPIDNNSEISANSETKPMSIVFSSSSNDPWQDYTNEDIFVYDDFDYESMTIEDFIKSIDPYQSSSNKCRYKNKSFVGKYIFICTNTPINKWYNEKRSEVRMALFKRINLVLDFIDKGDLKNYPSFTKIPEIGKAYFTVNKLDFDYFDSYISMSAKLLPVDKSNPVYEFDLSKYININQTEENTNLFLKQLQSMIFNQKEELL